MLLFKVDQLEQQYSRKANIIISGIPKLEAEDIHDVVHKLADKLKVPYNWQDIVTVHRLPAKKSNILPIIVRFVNYDSKSIWLKALKKEKLNGDALGLAPSTSIICDEHLTKRNNQLLKAAKDLKKADPGAVCMVKRQSSEDPGGQK